MAVRIVEDVPGGVAGRKFLRFFTVLLAWLLFGVAFVASLVPLLYGVITVSLLLSGDELPDLSENDGGIWLAGSTITMIATFWLGLRFIRGRRRMGLYLRKFGFAETTRTVSDSLRTAVGRSVRLVTLDDSVTQPVAGPRGARRAAMAVWLVCLAVVVLCLYGLFTGGFDLDGPATVSGPISDSALDRAIVELGRNVFEAVLSALVILMAIYFTVVFAVVGLVSLRTAGAAKRAEQAASQALAREQDVSRVARDLAAVARRTFSPRLMVVSVPTSFWQKAIRGLAGVCDVVIIDVSVPTDPLLWEVQNIKPLFAGRWILVGARDKVAALARPETQQLGTPQGMLARLLDGEEILAYGPGPSDGDRFARALRVKLAHLPRR